MIIYGNKLALIRHTSYYILHTAIFFGIICTFLTTPKVAIAQTPSRLTLSPALIRTTIEDPNTPVEAVFGLSNLTSETMSINASPQVIEQHDPFGRPVLSATQSASQSVTSQIELNPSIVTMFPGESVSFTATIHPQFLKPGGNYFSIIFQQQTDHTTATHTVIPALSGLLHIRNPNGEDRRLHLSSTNLPSITTKIPDNISVNFENPGNIEIVPYGEVIASSLFQGASQIGYLNQSSKSIYPGNTQELDTTLNVSAKPFIIDSLSYSIAGHDAENSIHFNHLQKVIYISPTALITIILLVLMTIFLSINKRYRLIKIARK